ncbi:GLPGLI family protein [Flavobacterium wongokense]|uniref:GLPGLI family protein n=1 Tax=Flavobacterium wongokense TaxID=2910674 RepID=UPI001F35AA8A|nr:GLPGLI family protein [Flavobacterium sp. WG47]MCF6133306.1 GLPGLI family protein [Flavobacterium sp. WG47]
MRNLLYTSLFLLAFITSNAQKDFQGMAVYESKTSTSDMKTAFSGNKNITPEMQKMIEERVKKALEKTYILNFDKSASIYKEEEKLDAPGTQGQGGGMRMMFNSFTGGGGTYYKNIKDKNYVSAKEFMGKEFLVKDSLPKLNWKMESESKVIGGYTCYKATAVKPVNTSDFRNFRKKAEDKKEDAAKNEDKEKTTNFMEGFEMPKEINITAWYAPEIPVSTGPDTYFGLPGLILEVNDGKTIILCSKVVLNAKEKVEIKAPTNGKEVTQKEYDETVIKKMKEMEEMNPGRGGMQIRMGH